MNRRKFLRFASLVVARGMVPPLPRAPLPDAGLREHEHGAISSLGYARAFFFGVPIRKEPHMAAPIAIRMKADETQPILAELTTQSGNPYNKQWYRLHGGYVFSAHVQPTPNEINPPVERAGEDGFWAEVTVPFADPRGAPSATAARSRYRYYGGTVFKVARVLPSRENPATVWYQIEDEMKPGLYFVPGQHMRAIPPEEFAPLSPDVDASEKKITVNLREQRARAFEHNREVMSWRVATGHMFDEARDFRTPQGNFFMYRKTPTQHMFGGEEGSSDFFDLPGIPWVSYFFTTGIAFHGVYWHNDFGTTRSHGCVNTRTDIAKWVWRWSAPANKHEERYTMNYKRAEGTTVVVS